MTQARNMRIYIICYGRIFFYVLDGYYTTKSNMEVGYGRVDIILFPKDEIKGEDILELKKG